MRGITCLRLRVNAGWGCRVLWLRVSASLLGFSFRVYGYLVWGYGYWVCPLRLCVSGRVPSRPVRVGLVVGVGCCVTG